jgi:hypothetical protein
MLANSETTIELRNNQDSVMVSESRYSLSIVGLRKDETYHLSINDQFVTTVSNGFYSTIIDLINHFGYNKVNITDKDNKSLFQCIFFTHSYKLDTEDFYRMIQFVQKELFGINNQFIYFDHENRVHEIVDPLFIFNWIDKHFDIIEKLVMKINHLNLHLRKTLNLKTFMNTHHYDKQSTISFLRNNQHYVFETDSRSGIIHVDHRHFQPQAMIRNKKITDYKLEEHKQIFELILLMYRFLTSLNETLKKERYDSIRQECFSRIERNKYIPRLAFMKNNTFLKEFSNRDLLFINRYPKSSLQLTNSSYGEMYNLYQSFISNYFQVISMENDSFYQHIKNIDKIYEAFCCYVLADMLELAPVANNSAIDSGLAFHNESLHLYYQAKPKEMKGWCLSDTPDIIIQNRMGKTILLDCKFKMKDKHSIKGEDVQKIQAYLNNYHKNLGGVLYPGNEYSMKMDEIQGQFIMLHIPIYPFESHLYAYFKTRIKNDIYLLLT